MNNGRPPYGHMPAGNQGGQIGGAAGGYAPRPAGYNGYSQPLTPGQGGYPVQGTGYPPQGVYPQGQVPPGQGQVLPGQGQPVYPPQGVYPQGQMPPGQTPVQGVYPQGQVPPGQGQPVYPPQGVYPQGQVPPGQGQVQGMYPQGQQAYPPQGRQAYPPQGVYPQGQPMSPGQGVYPQGQPMSPGQGQVPPGQGQVPPGQGRQPIQQVYPPVYPQGQQHTPQMYVGYQPDNGQNGPKRRKQPKGQGGLKQPIPPETIALMVVGGVLPVLLILGMALPSAAWLKWVCVVMTVAAIAYVWLRDAIKGSLKLTLSLIYGALAVVALVSALTGVSPMDTRVQNNHGVNGDQQGGQTDVFGAGNGAPTWQETQAPTAEPVVTQAVTEGAAKERLESFFYLWSVNNLDSMLNFVSPSWQSSVTDPKQELFFIKANRTPVDYDVTGISGTEADTSRTASVRVSIDRNNGRDPEVYLMQVVLVKQNDLWYIDPLSLKSNERETATVEGGGNTTPTQPPLTTSYPGLTCYYNPNGGSYYHINQNCSSAAASNLPFKGSFDWTEVNNEPYSSLQACNVCGAPLRGE